MNIKIGENTKVNMKIMEIENFPFSSEELSANYRKLMKKHHPEKGGNPEKAQQISVAYSELKNFAIHVTNEKAAIIREEKISDQENIFERIFWKKCSTCKGTGKKVFTITNIKTQKEEYKVIKCPDCYGNGEVKSKPFNPVIPAGAVMR